MIVEKKEQRWSVSVAGDYGGKAVDLVAVNSIDGDPTLAKLSIPSSSGGRHETMVPVSDLIELLGRIAANVNGASQEERVRKAIRSLPYDELSTSGERRIVVTASGLEAVMLDAIRVPLGLAASPASERK